MIIRAALSALHILALAIGFGAIFARGRRLRDLRRSPDDAGVLRRLFQADNFWGLNDAEVAIVLLIPFAAALMARGAWLF